MSSEVECSARRLHARVGRVSFASDFMESIQLCSN